MAQPGHIEESDFSENFVTTESFNEVDHHESAPHVNESNASMAEVGKPVLAGHTYDLSKCGERLLETVHVVVRIRPSRSQSDDHRWLLSDDNSSIREPAQPTVYTVDRILKQGVSQVETFEAVAAPMIRRFLAGYNTCIFAYGQTGSGKTFTMTGKCQSSALAWRQDDYRGLIPRVLEAIVDWRTQHPNSGDIRFTASYVEIYNEKIRDLFADSTGQQSINPLALGYKNFVNGLTHINISDIDSALALIIAGTLKRVTAATNSNADSSRSHAVLIVNFEHVTPTGTFRSTLHLIDLAGSENAKNAQTSAERLTEGNAINKSLSALSRLLMDLSKNKKQNKHINFRDSTLTWLLKDALSQLSQVCLIANISPDNDDVITTRSTLNFAKTAKSVQTKAAVPNFSEALKKIGKTQSFERMLALESVDVSDLYDEKCDGFETAEDHARWQTIALLHEGLTRMIKQTESVIRNVHAAHSSSPQSDLTVPCSSEDSNIAPNPTASDHTHQTISSRSSRSEYEKCRTMQLKHTAIMHDAQVQTQEQKARISPKRQRLRYDSDTEYITLNDENIPSGCEQNNQHVSLPSSCVLMERSGNFHNKSQNAFNKRDPFKSIMHDAYVAVAEKEDAEVWNKSRVVERRIF